MLPNYTHWADRFNTGHPVIDAEHRELIAACNRLSQLCAVDGGNDVADAAFLAEYDGLMQLARAHFAHEQNLLLATDDVEREDYRCEVEEFEFLATQIATAENFDKVELQRFLSLWWIGHIHDAVRQRYAPA